MPVPERVSDIADGGASMKRCDDIGAGCDHPNTCKAKITWNYPDYSNVDKFIIKKTDNLTNGSWVFSAEISEPTSEANSIDVWGDSNQTDYFSIKAKNKENFMLDSGDYKHNDLKFTADPGGSVNSDCGISGKCLLSRPSNSDYYGSAYNCCGKTDCYVCNSTYSFNGDICVGGGGAETAYYTIGGNITGLSGTVILQNNSVDNLSRSANGSFTFANQVLAGSHYEVTVYSQPNSQTCTVANGIGTANSNIISVAVNCTTNTMPSITGGDDISHSGEYTIHTFLSSGELKVSNLTTPINAEVTVVGGGGGGDGGGANYEYVGNGGAGGTVRYDGSYPINNNDDISVTIGHDGAGGEIAENGGAGGSSAFGSISAKGGNGSWGQYGRYGGNNDVPHTGGIGEWTGGGGGAGAGADGDIWNGGLVLVAMVEEEEVDIMF